MLACQQAALGKFICRALAAHGFCNQADLRVIFNDGKILNKFFLIRCIGEITQIKDIFYFNGISCVFCNHICIAVKYFIYAGAHGAKAHNSSFHHSGFPPSFHIRRGTFLFPCQNFHTCHAGNSHNSSHHFLHRAIHITGPCRDGHSSLSVYRNGLVNGEDIGPTAGKYCQNL